MQQQQQAFSFGTPARPSMASTPVDYRHNRRMIAVPTAELSHADQPADLNFSQFNNVSFSSLLHDHQ
jgi:hypothetical protein